MNAKPNIDRLSVCLSVRLSVVLTNAGVVSNRMYIVTLFDGLVEASFYFSDPTAIKKFNGIPRNQGR